MYTNVSGVFMTYITSEFAGNWKGFFPLKTWGFGSEYDIVVFFEFYFFEGIKHFGLSQIPL